MTLKRFVMLVERHKERVKREDRRAGEIIAILFNINRDPEKQQGIDWEDVFPEWKEELPVQTDEQMLETMKFWMLATGGNLPST